MATDPTYAFEVALKKYRTGHFSSLPVEKLPAFLVRFHDYKGRLNRQTYLAIRLMLLTFARTSELIVARWDEIDFENSLNENERGTPCATF